MSEIKHESDALEYSLAMVLADIRIKTGVGVEPMLFELADVLAAKLAAKDARIAELEAALRGWQKVPEGHVVAPKEKECNHTHYQYDVHGRRCSCGKLMVDFGD